MTSASPTILVVDDIPANLSVLLDLLTGAGFEVLVADSGERALLQVSHRRPDLILLDAMMPGLDGFGTCRRLKSDPATSDLPVLFMTASTDTAARLAGFAAGAVDYISKPFEPEEVLARLRVQLEMQRLRRALEAEVRLRQNAEAQLERSLSQAVLVIDSEGHLIFCRPPCPRTVKPLSGRSRPRRTVAARAVGRTTHFAPARTRLPAGAPLCRNESRWR